MVWPFIGGRCYVGNVPKSTKGEQRFRLGAGSRLRQPVTCRTAWTICVKRSLHSGAIKGLQNEHENVRAATNDLRHSVDLIHEKVGAGNQTVRDVSSRG